MNYGSDKPAELTKARKEALGRPVVTYVITGVVDFDVLVGARARIPKHLTVYVHGTAV